MKTIFVDFNSIGEAGRLFLTSRLILARIARFKPPLREGEVVLLTDQEIKTTASVHRITEHYGFMEPDWPYGYWYAKSDWKFVSCGR